MRHGLGCQDMLDSPLYKDYDGLQRKSCGENTARLCDRNVRCHGYTILRSMVPAIPQLLGKLVDENKHCNLLTTQQAVPTPNKQCDAATNHLITNACFNLSSDVAMLLIGLPIFLRMKLPWRKKIPLIGIFSLGIFTILSAILNKVYSFTRPFGAEWTYWYTRESSTALLVANLPFLWTFYRAITGFRSLNGQSRHDSLSPEDATSQYDNGGRRGTNGTIGRSMSAVQSLEGHEMRDRPLRERQMTLPEMLGGGFPSSIDDKEPNEITHPALFYSKNRGASVSKPQSSTEKAAYEHGPDFQTIHGETGDNGVADTTPTSSVYPASKDKESTNSFV